MSGNNETILREALTSFRKQQYDKLEVRLVRYCGQILTQAVNARLFANNAHNFTGNLINSIVVGLFREGKLVMFVTPSSEQGIERPIRKKMTYPFKYYFSEDTKRSKYGLDYDQTHPSSFYEPELKTNLAYGTGDARRFIKSYPASKNAVFQIVVGYTTEYASWVETKRHTTGYMEMIDWVQMTAGERL